MRESEWETLCDDSSGVLVEGVVLQGGEVAIDGLLALVKGGGRIVEALLQALPMLGGAHIEFLEPLEHFVERLGDDRIHRTPSSLQAREMLVGDRCGLQSSPATCL